MSADNWAICPKCKKETPSREDAIAKAKEQYGKIPLLDFQRLLEKAEKTSDDPPQTLREDYELGIDVDGLFEVNYRASCEECGFSFRFHEKKPAT